MSGTRSIGPIVETASGPVSGTIVDDVMTFLGIPYAQPITPETRFLPALPVTPWHEPWGATSPGPVAPQHGLGGSVESDESCHRLHIWARTGAAGKRPVVVWLHGGGWYRGEPVTPLTDGTNLAATADVVVVSITHRLGLLGCLYLADHLGDGYRESGTAVIDDLVLALQWIRDNIEAFGGDPDNVTLVGCSGGGAKTASLFAVPAARGLVRRAIAQSGSAEHYLDPSEGVALTDQVLRLLELPRERAAELLTVPVATLSAVQAELFRESPWTPILGTSTGLLPFPTINGGTLAALPRDLLADPEDQRSLVIGSARDEAILPLSLRASVISTDADVADAVRPNLGDAAETLVQTYRARRPTDSPHEILVRLGSDVESFRARRLAAARDQGGPTRLYRLDWGSSAYDGVPRACHCLEVGLVFRNVDTEPVLAGQPGAATVSTLLSDAVVDFARGADDLRVGEVEWQQFTTESPAGMIVSTTPSVHPEIHAEALEIWEPYTELVRR